MPGRERTTDNRTRAHAIAAIVTFLSAAFAAAGPLHVKSWPPGAGAGAGAGAGGGDCCWAGCRFSVQALPSQYRRVPGDPGSGYQPGSALMVTHDRAEAADRDHPFG